MKLDPRAKLELVLSCEHGGRRIPARYRSALAGAEQIVASHRGWDAGALTLARALARSLDAPLQACTTTRLLVDPNRSSWNPRVFSEWSRGLPPDQRQALLERCWAPHRIAVEELVRSRAQRTVLHVSVHSFTPRWNGRMRAVDVGLLYDPARSRERSLAAAWLRELGARRSDLRLRRNQPYRGNADGLTTALRGRFGAGRYLGLELEVSQRFALGPAAPWRRLRRDLVESLRGTLDGA